MVLDVYVYPLQAGVPPLGGTGMRGMNRPALQLRRLVAVAVRLVRAAGSVPMWALYVMTAMASISRSDWAFSMHARAWALAWSGIAMAATTPKTATTMSSSMRVKPPWPTGHRWLRFTSFIVKPPFGSPGTYRRSGGRLGTRP